MMAKLPAFQFYPGDWMKDPSLRSCSLAARGLWIDMICMMHESDRRGYLVHVTGVPITEGELARIVGSTQKDTRARLMELGRAGVYSMTDEGVIYSRRVVRDEDARRRCRDNGRKGGNPALLGLSDKGGVNPPVNQPDNQTANPDLTPSSSSSTSSSSSSPSGVKTGHSPKRFTPPTVEEVGAYCRERENTIDPEAFVAWYDTRGWILGNGKVMKNWRSAVITWEKNDGRRNGSTASGGTGAGGQRTTPQARRAAKAEREFAGDDHGTFIRRFNANEPHDSGGVRPANRT